MPGRLLQNHLAHGFTKVKSFLSHGYQTGRKVLSTIDMYSGLARRVLSAAQPMLADMGVQDQVNRVAMRGASAYDEVKSNLTTAHSKAGDHYSRIAQAVG